MNETDQKELAALRTFFEVSEKHMPSGGINDAPADFQAAHAAVLATRHPGDGYSKDLRSLGASAASEPATAFSGHTEPLRAETNAATSPIVAPGSNVPAGDTLPAAGPSDAL